MILLLLSLGLNSFQKKLKVFVELVGLLVLAVLVYVRPGVLLGGVVVFLQQRSRALGKRPFVLRFGVRVESCVAQVTPPTSTYVVAFSPFFL